MNRLLLLGALPLILGAELLQEVVVEEGNTTSEESIAEESFYRTYTKHTVSKKEISESGATDIKSVLSDIPGVRLKESGSFNKKLIVRGLSNERVVSVVDGAKLVNQGITHGGGGELGLVDLSTVEDIELVKGSPNVIYDPGATGGVVLVNTIKDTSKLENSWGGKYSFGYNGGYLMKKHSLFLEGKYEGFYSSITVTDTDSEDRNVEDKQRMQDALDKINGEDERFGTEFEVTDLGYTSKAYQYLGSYQFADSGTIYLKRSEYKAEDITFMHGASNPMIFHYKEYSRENTALGINTQSIWGLDSLRFNFSNQAISKVTQPNILTKHIIDVESNTIKIDAKKMIDAHEIRFGLERSKDDAKTNTFSEQTYMAGYLSGVYNHEDFVITAGLRYNKYHTKQNIEPGRNLDTIYDLVGVSGVLKEPIDESGWSYAAGVTYLINDNNNISFNYAKTYRYPSLYERFAFDRFIGGGADMKAEEGNNYELSYKYLDDTLSVTATVFRTNFDTFNSLYRFVTIKDIDYLRSCNRDPLCDPFDGGDNERKIFQLYLKHASFNDITNSGFEFSIKKTFPEQKIDIGFNASLSKLTDGHVLLGNATEATTIRFAQDPLEFSAFIKKEFDYEYKPWIKLKVRHVTNRPEVKQENGFEAFTVADLSFGAEYKDFTLNAGIKNLTNEIYHEPYMGLDGIKRSFFVNLTAAF